MRPGERVCLFLKRSSDTYRGGQLLHTTSMGQGHLTLAAPGQTPGRLQPHEATVNCPRRRQTGRPRSSLRFAEASDA